MSNNNNNISTKPSRTSKSLNSAEQVVLTKYVAGGKEVVIYNNLTGECRVERTVKGKTSVKTFAKTVAA